MALLYMLKKQLTKSLHQQDFKAILVFTPSGLGFSSFI